MGKEKNNLREDEFDDFDITGGLDDIATSRGESKLIFPSDTIDVQEAKTHAEERSASLDSGADFIPEPEDDHSFDQAEKKTPKEKSDIQKRNKRREYMVIAGIFFAILIGIVLFGYSVYSDMTKPQANAGNAQVVNKEVKTEEIKPAADFAALPSDTGEVGVADQFAEQPLGATLPDEAGYSPQQGNSDQYQNNEANYQAEYQQQQNEASPQDDISYPDTSPALTGVELEMMGVSSKSVSSDKGGVCDLSVKYKTDIEYVYYLFDGKEYIPAFKDKNWDGKGIKLHNREVSISHDPINNFTEIEEGKFIPSEVFSQCSAFEKN